MTGYLTPLRVKQNKLNNYNLNNISLATVDDIKIIANELATNFIEVLTGMHAIRLWATFYGIRHDHLVDNSKAVDFFILCSSPNLLLLENINQYVKVCLYNSEVTACFSNNIHNFRVFAREKMPICTTINDISVITPEQLLKEYDFYDIDSKNNDNYTAKKNILEQICLARL
jgi:hypothetical protein